MSWLVSGLYLAGNVLLGHRRPAGWVVTGLADTALALYGAATRQWGFVLSLIFIPVRVVGWQKWTRSAEVVAVEPSYGKWERA